MNKRIIITDLLAGLTVSFAALALGAAFGIMSGRGAFAGMIAAAVIPIITGLFGGTRLSVSGPTGPMTAVSSLVVAFAYESFQDKILAEVVGSEYKYGFYTDIEMDTAPMGLNEDIVRFISAKNLRVCRLCFSLQYDHGCSFPGLFH